MDKDEQWLRLTQEGCRHVEIRRNDISLDGNFTVEELREIIELFEEGDGSE